MTQPARAGASAAAAFSHRLARRYALFMLAFGALIVLFLLFWAARKLVHSPFGLGLKGIRLNVARMPALGAPVNMRLAAVYTIGAAYAGVAGALFASLVQFIEPAPFTVGASIMMYLMVVVGGPGYFLGPVIGAAVGVLLPEWLRFAQAWYLFMFGSAVVLLMIWLPDGLLSIPDRIKARRQAKEASAARAAAAQAAAQSGAKA